MTILHSLTTLYDRLSINEEMPELGYSKENISFSIVLNAAGDVLHIADKRSYAETKPKPIKMNVPARSGTRTSGIRPNFFWDKTAYVLGIVGKEHIDCHGKKYKFATQEKRTKKEHAAFVEEHNKLLSDTNDPGLLALKRFLIRWKPEMFGEKDYNCDILDTNIVFEFDDGSGSGFIHDRPAAKSLFDSKSKQLADTHGMCLVTGEHAPIERLHFPIKGVPGAKSSGAPLVSFNEQAYWSYNKEQGFNAPVSTKAVTAYGTALNELLIRGSKRKFEVGNTTVVFWAQAQDNQMADLTERLMAHTFNAPDNDSELSELREAISSIARGRQADPTFDPATHIFILGLAPNAARLSVRFWHPGTFGDFAKRTNQFWSDLEIEPSPWKTLPVAWSLLNETAIRINGKPQRDTIPPLLGGKIMQSVLSGQALPRMLLSSVISRIRADHEINGRRAAICKAIINHQGKENIPVSLDPNNNNQAYRLGRLFAILEKIQKSALNITKIKDQYFSAAASTPARVFPIITKTATHHLAHLKKGEDRNLGYWFEKQLELIWAGLDAELPKSLRLEDQGRFIAGYYHQMNHKKDTKTNSENSSETIKIVNRGN